MDDDSFLKYQVHKGSGTHIAVIKIEIIEINYSEAKNYNCWDAYTLMI